ncbi:hypothetical protein [Azospirillum sp. B2RO_4]
MLAAKVFSAVIPAKAGIQPVHRLIRKDSWIPAFAGMTVEKYRLKTYRL